MILVCCLFTHLRQWQDPVRVAVKAGSTVFSALTQVLRQHELPQLPDAQDVSVYRGGSDSGGGGSCELILCDPALKVSADMTLEVRISHHPTDGGTL